jgi:hypothetical protein
MEPESPNNSSGSEVEEDTLIIEEKESDNPVKIESRLEQMLDALTKEVSQLNQRISQLESQNTSLQIELQNERSFHLNESHHTNASGASLGTTSDEASILRHMLTVQEDIEHSLNDEIKRLRDQVVAHHDVLRRWAPIVLGREIGANVEDFRNLIGNSTETAMTGATMAPNSTPITLSIPAPIPAPVPALEPPSAASGHSPGRVHYTAPTMPTTTQMPASASASIPASSILPSDPNELRAHFLAPQFVQQYVPSPHSKWNQGAGKPVNMPVRTTGFGSSYDIPYKYSDSPTPTMSNKSKNKPHTRLNFSAAARAVGVGMAHGHRINLEVPKKTRSKVQLEAEVKRILMEHHSPQRPVEVQIAYDVDKRRKPIKAFK